MAIKLKGGAVFLHIPKTGGSFIENVLAECQLIECNIAGKHDDAYRTLHPINYKSRVKQVINEFPGRLAAQLKPNLQHDWRSGPQPHQPTKEDIPFMFCFVRHPLRWLESYFRYASSLNWYHWSTEYDYRDFWHPNALLNNLGSDDFNQFIRNVIEKRPGYVTEMYGWYTQPGVRFVGKTETLSTDLVKVLEMLGLDFDKEIILNRAPINVSKTPKNPLVWEKDLKEEVLRLEYTALKRYGYSIDEHVI